MKEIAAMAEPYYVSVAPHGYNCMTVGLAATMQVSAAMPNFLITDYFVPTRGDAAAEIAPAFCRGQLHQPADRARPRHRPGRGGDGAPRVHAAADAQAPPVRRRRAVAARQLELRPPSPLADLLGVLAVVPGPHAVEEAAPGAPSGANCASGMVAAAATKSRREASSSAEHVGRLHAGLPPGHEPRVPRVEVVVGARRVGSRLPLPRGGRSPGSTPDASPRCGSGSRAHPRCRATPDPSPRHPDRRSSRCSSPNAASASRSSVLLSLIGAS